MTPEDQDAFGEAREQVDAHAEMFRDRFLSTELALWAALMSLSGIFISAASVIATIGDKKAFTWLLSSVVFSTFSMLLLVMNFQARRSMYRFLGKPPPADVWDNAHAFSKYVESAKKQKIEAIAEQQKCESRERTVYCSLVIGSTLLVVGSYRASIYF